MTTVALFVVRDGDHAYVAWDTVSAALWLIYLIVEFLALLITAATWMTGRRMVVGPVVNRS